MSGGTNWLRVKAPIRRWLCCVALAIVSFVRSRVSSTWRRQAAASPRSAARLPPVGQQLLDSAVQLRGQPREDVLQVSPRLVSVELCALKQTDYDGSTLACQLASYEERVLLGQHDRPDPVFTVVVMCALLRHG